MSAGHAGRDLSRITTDDWRAECAVRGCKWMDPNTYSQATKATMIRRARAHAAEDRHDVMLIAITVQRVKPPRD